MDLTNFSTLVSDDGMTLVHNDGTALVGLDDGKSIEVGLEDGEKVSAKNGSVDEDMELGIFSGQE